MSIVTCNVCGCYVYGSPTACICGDCVRWIEEQIELGMWCHDHNEPYTDCDCIRPEDEDMIEGWIDLRGEITAC
ncbi:MAG: hypothetical protein ACYTF1_14090 [Planctomycetota bacterium]|jgi:hypothetical protein